MKASVRGIIFFFFILNLLFINPVFQISGSLAAQLEEVFPLDGLGVVVTVDQPAYYTEFMPPNMQLGDPEYPEILMSITLFNNTAEPVTFTEYCIMYGIYDSLDVVAWEQNLCQPVEVTLYPGESRSHSTVHTFQELSGDPMPEDLYSLKGGVEVIFPGSFEGDTRPGFQNVRTVLDGTVSFWHTYASASPSGSMSGNIQDSFPLDDFGVVVRVDQPKYITHFMPPDIKLGDKEYPVIQMDVTIFNSSDAPVRFTQECYHFKIFNSNGDLVWEKNSCRPSQELLNPGDSITFSHARLFRDEDTFPAGPMPEDRYTLEGSIDVSFPESYSWKPVFQGFIGEFKGNISFLHSYGD